MRVIRREDLARAWGVSPNVIDNMLQRGQLRRVGRGLIDHDHAQQVRSAQDPAGREREMIRKAAGLTQLTRRPRRGRPRAEDDVAHPVDQSSAVEAEAGHVDVLLRARVAKTVADAQLAQMDLKRAAGALIEVDKVRRDASDAARLLVARLKALPARLGPLLATVNEPAACAKAVREEIDLLAGELLDALAAL